MTKTPEKPAIAGVAGHPVRHSLSPILHGHWLKKYEINGSYVPLEIPPESFESRVRQLMAEDYKGINVTVPHKEAAFRLADVSDAVSSAAKATNTLVFKDSKIYGYNTDVYGFKQSLVATFPNYKKEKAVLLGAGGAARGVLLALTELGFDEIIITNRSHEKADALAKEFGQKAAPWEEKHLHLGGANLLVNSTSLGLGGKEDLAINLENLPLSAIVYDIVYKPLETGLIRLAKSRGNPVMNGLKMLAYQAVPGFEMWFGQRPEVTDELLKLLERSV